jgi:hypothetical protein
MNSKKKISKTNNNKKVSKYGKKYKCCFLLTNGNRCNNTAIGKRGKIFIVHCEIHRDKCLNKYKYYKKYCNKIYDLSSRDILKKHTFCEGVSKKGSKNRDDLLRKCINERFNYSRNCTDGCLIDPHDMESFDIQNIEDLKHRHEILMLIKNRLGCKDN